MCIYVVIILFRSLYPRERAPDTIRYVEGSGQRLSGLYGMQKNLWPPTVHPKSSSLLTSCYTNSKVVCLIQLVFPNLVVIRSSSFVQLTLRLLMSYIYGAPSKARNANVVYIWNYVWQS